MLLAVFFTVTPGFLLYSDATSVYFYYTDESSASTGTSNLATPLLALNGISGNCCTLFVVTVVV